MSKPVYVSPFYLRLLSQLMEESNYGDVGITDFSHWLNMFKNYLTCLADLNGQTCEGKYPSWRAFISEEIRLVSEAQTNG